MAASSSVFPAALGSSRRRWPPVPRIVAALSDENVCETKPEVIVTATNPTTTIEPVRNVRRA